MTSPRNTQYSRIYNAQSLKKLYNILHSKLLQLSWKRNKIPQRTQSQNYKYVQSNLENPHAMPS